MTVAQPIYPERARLDGVEGVVQLRVWIDETGTVREVAVVRPAGYGFDEAAVTAMYQFKFSPGCSTLGRPVPVRIIWTFRFDLATDRP